MARTRWAYASAARRTQSELIRDSQHTSSSDQAFAANSSNCLNSTLRRGWYWGSEAFRHKLLDLRLEEGMALLKKKEALCLELTNRSGLGYCYWNWGQLAGRRGDRKTEREKLTAALDIFTQLNMPRERDAVRVETEQDESGWPVVALEEFVVHQFQSLADRTRL